MIILAYLISTNIAKPIIAVTTHAELLSEGDLSHTTNQIAVLIKDIKGCS